MLPPCWAPSGFEPERELQLIDVTATTTVADVKRQLGYTCEVYLTHLNSWLEEENKSLTDYNVSHEDVLELHLGSLESC